jgi:hypothetical protein
MKTIAKYMVVLLLLTIALPFVVAAGSSSVTAYTGAILGDNNTTLTIAPFYAPIFGVHIFAGSEPVGAYWLNSNTSYVYHPILNNPK